jgi:hypothetical protein
MTPYEKLVKEISKTKKDRKGIHYKRKPFIKIDDDGINQLYDKYFDKINLEENCYSFVYNTEDLDKLLIILRCHFKLWIEHTNSQITIFKHFPKKFIIVKEVNKENHWFTPEIFEKGTILYFTENNFGTANLLNGIPLSKSLKSIEGTNIIPSTQINYEFIEPIEA